MASYTKDKKTGKPVLKSQIETPYQPDQMAARPAKAVEGTPEQPKAQEASK